MNKSKYYTLMFIPEDNGKSFSLRIHKYILYTLFLFLLIFSASLIILLSKSGEIAAKLQLLHSVKTENERLSSDIKNLKQISDKMDKIEIISKYLENLALFTTISDSNYLKNNEKKANFNFFWKKQDSLHLSSKNVPSSNVSTSFDRLVSVPNILPVEGWITRHFSLDSTSSFHQGVDFAAASGTPIRATAMGIVEDVINDKYFGLMVIIRHDHSFVTRYGHCSQVLVSRNDNVNRGQTIALVGNTGRSTAPHLHYEVIKDGKHINPSDFLLVPKD